MVSRDAESLSELLRDFPELDLREALEVGYRPVFLEVLRAVDVREHGRDGLLRENELQGGLGAGHPLAVVDPPEVRRALPALFHEIRALHAEAFVLRERARPPGGRGAGRRSGAGVFLPTGFARRKTNPHPLCNCPCPPPGLPSPRPTSTRVARG